MSCGVTSIQYQVIEGGLGWELSGDRRETGLGVIRRQREDWAGNYQVTEWRLGWELSGDRVETVLGITK